MQNRTEHRVGGPFHPHFNLHIGVVDCEKQPVETKRFLCVGNAAKAHQRLSPKPTGCVQQESLQSQTLPPHTNRSMLGLHNQTSTQYSPPPPPPPPPPHNHCHLAQHHNNNKQKKQKTRAL